MIPDILSCKCCGRVDACVVYNAAGDRYIVKVLNCCRIVKPSGPVKLDVVRVSTMSSWVTADGSTSSWQPIQPIFWKHQVASCGVGCVIRNCNLCSSGDLIDRLHILRNIRLPYCRDRATQRDPHYSSR